MTRRRPGRRPRPAEDQGRPDRAQAPGHPQQLRRRPDALGHLSHGRGELPRLLLDRPEGGRRQARSPRVSAARQQKSYERYGVPGNWYSWGKFHDRFNVDKEANEPNRFDWIVEIDPIDPTSTPVKHTALGRFRHEGAEMIVNKDGRVVVYSGDDSQFEYVYRFVSKEPLPGPATRRTTCGCCPRARCRWRASTRTARVTWLPLVFGEGPLTPANGFNSQADVLIDARLAGRPAQGDAAWTGRRTCSRIPPTARSTSC